MSPRAVAGILGFAFLYFDFSFDFLFLSSCDYAWRFRHSSDRARICQGIGLLGQRSTQNDGGNMDETDFEAASKMEKEKEEVRRVDHGK